MDKKIKIGTCGVSYLNAPQEFGPDWKKKFKSVTQAYATIFPAVEVNTTFYKIPKVETAERWREDVDEVNKKFEFTVKCSQMVTHLARFSRKAHPAFNRMKEICEALRAKILLLQSPESFKPTATNIEKAKTFFKKINRADLDLVWEVRWAKDWTKEIVNKLFKEINAEQCIDPSRQDFSCNKKFFYYRLHGLGMPSMYWYKFSNPELKGLFERCKKNRKETYVFFNNTDAWDDAVRFSKIS